MRKMILSLAAAGAALVAASPAAAQYYQQPQPYGYGYGFQNNWGQVRELQVRIDRVEWQINRLDRFDRIGDGRADRLRAEANDIERQLRFATRNGLNPNEANMIRFRIDRLQQRVQYSVAGGYGRYGYDGYSNDRYDRDHQRWHDRHDRDDDDRDDD